VLPVVITPLLSLALWTSLASVASGMNDSPRNYALVGGHCYTGNGFVAKTMRIVEGDLRVSVHVETAADFRLAVCSGADEIPHLPRFLVLGGNPLEDWSNTRRIRSSFKDGRPLRHPRPARPAGLDDRRP
jgi:hypothetical protein